MLEARAGSREKQLTSLVMSKKLERVESDGFDFPVDFVLVGNVAVLAACPQTSSVLASFYSITWSLLLFLLNYVQCERYLQKEPD